MLPPLNELLNECSRQHGHLCPGQVLGARMAILGCNLVGILDPRQQDRKKIIVWVEIDRCLADAVGIVTGTRLGRRTLKFVDYGKVAATFFNTKSNRAYRIFVPESSRKLADLRYGQIADKKTRQMQAYTDASDNELFISTEVTVQYNEFDLPGPPRSRVSCAKCGEGVNDRREVISVLEKKLCRPCAA
ncbi:MAG: formylmethanofuran dehydrogenase, partial [Pyrinomonadaceae bacterium]|nr:formylmethanofuran dehydrogenase [Pyrinomonadaceae bacterium]